MKGKLHHWEDPLCLSVGSLPSQDNRLSENAWKPQSEEAQLLSSSLLAFVFQAGLPWVAPIGCGCLAALQDGQQLLGSSQGKSDTAAAADLVI